MAKKKSEPEQEIEETPTEEIIKDLEEANEKEYYGELKKKNKGYLIEGLSAVERERIARHIKSLYEDNKSDHQELCDKIDEYDSVWKMAPQSISGDDGSIPNYVSPISTVTLEVVHANIMNVFFSPKDIVRAIPTEESDIPKIKKIDIFANWSAVNELELFTNLDRLFHSSAKNGECPYAVEWCKEYATEIKRRVIMNPANPSEPLYDEETQEPIYQEYEETKLVYNAPVLEVFSRKDYIQPKSALMDQQPEWEMRIVRKSYDWFLREYLQGKMFDGSIEEIKGWGEKGDQDKIGNEGDDIPLGKWESEFILFFGRLRINVIKNDKEKDTEELKELEDEFIGLLHIGSETLCQLRKNKFPLKMRPIGIDYFIPDDEGRRVGHGIVELMDGIQKGYDALFNQYTLATVQANNPIAFIPMFGNLKNEPIKLRFGYMMPVSDPSGVKVEKFPPPDASITNLMDIIRMWAQLLFGISDYATGVESQIDPSAPAKKAEIVVQQGNVRLNMIVKRKIRTIQDILFRWFMLYRENMPPNKFMRITGASEANPWKFENITIEDFALKSIPDFELTGNILNVNKTLEANKKVAIYQMMLMNPFFSPQTAQGLQALHSLTKWVLDGIDDTGIGRFLPQLANGQLLTPQEENARIMQGDVVEPNELDDIIYHMQTHMAFINDPNMPEQIKQFVVKHIQQHIEKFKNLMTKQSAIGQAATPPGGQIGQPATAPQGAAQGMVQQQTADMGGYGGGNEGNTEIAPGNASQFQL